MKNWNYAALIILMAACSTGEKESKGEAVSADSNGITNKTVAGGFDENTFNVLQLPLVIDTNFILEVDTNQRIPYQQLRQLGANFLDTEISSGLVYDINSFCEIDSLKQAGAYAQYVSKLDIGMTKIAISFKLGRIDLKNGARLFLWGVHNSSYEACPFFGGTTIIGTYVNTNKQNTHFVIGEISAGGDPPSMGNDEVTAKINTNNEVVIRRVSVNDDLDIAGEQTTTLTLVLKLNGERIEKVSATKTEKNTEKAQSD
ncbi:MAG: hypothetical protein H0W61_11970 [Bacteroidetes bacterium]|nr:hypothetical protein [Bacteroidota bacterium]